MSVTVRPYRRGGWEVDIRLVLPNGSEHRRRLRAPVTSRSAAQRWAEDRQRHLYDDLAHPGPQSPPKQEVPTLETFAPRFLDEHARAERHKPSGVSAKDSIIRVHLVPLLGSRKLNAITTEEIQRVKRHLVDRAPKTVNNALTVLNTLLKKAVEWRIIEQMPCTIRLLKIPPSSAGFYDFEEYQRLVAAARVCGPTTYLVMLLGVMPGCGAAKSSGWSGVTLTRESANCVCGNPNGGDM